MGALSILPVHIFGFIFTDYIFTAFFTVYTSYSTSTYRRHSLETKYGLIVYLFDFVFHQFILTPFIASVKFFSPLNP